jgi:hypothetical protein
MVKLFRYLFILSVAFSLGAHFAAYVVAKLIDNGKMQELINRHEERTWNGLTGMASGNPLSQW